MTKREAVDIMLTAGNVDKKVIDKAGIYKAVDDKLDGYSIVENNVESGEASGDIFGECLADIVTNGYLIKEMDIGNSGYTVKMYAYDTSRYPQLFKRSNTPLNVTMKAYGEDVTVTKNQFSTLLALMMVVCVGNTPLYARYMQHYNSMQVEKYGARMVIVDRTDPDYQIYGSYYYIFIPLYKIEYIGITVKEAEMYFRKPTDIDYTTLSASFYFRCKYVPKIRITTYFTEQPFDVYSIDDFIITEDKVIESDYDGIVEFVVDGRYTNSTTIPKGTKYSVWNFGKSVGFNTNFVGEYYTGPLITTLDNATFKSIIDRINTEALKEQMNLEGYEFFKFPDDLSYP